MVHGVGFVPKKDGRWRYARGLQALNKKTVKDRYLLLRIDLLLDRLGQARVFSKLDLAQGYHEIGHGKWLYRKDRLLYKSRPMGVSGLCPLGCAMHPVLSSGWWIHFVSGKSLLLYWFTWTTFWSIVVQWRNIGNIYAMHLTSCARHSFMDVSISANSLRIKWTTLVLRQDARGFAPHLKRWGLFWIGPSRSQCMTLDHFWG